MNTVRASVRLRVVPNASRSEILGWMADGCLKVKVQAPPEGGRANEEVCTLMARALGLSKRAVKVVAGEKSRLKTLSLTGLPEEAIKMRFPGNKKRGSVLG